MRRFGGLWKKMPVTFVTFGLGYLALIGFPFLLGLLHQGRDHRGGVRPRRRLGLGARRRRRVLGAGLTAFYMTRLMLMTFFGRARVGGGRAPARVARRSMTVPMVVLAVGSVVAGFLLVSVFPLTRLAGAGVRRAGGGRARHRAAHRRHRRHRGHARSASCVAWLFVGRREVPVTAPVRVSPVTRAARNALYADTVNESLFMRPGQWLTRALVFVDNRGVDGAVNGLAADARRLVVAAGPGADRLRPVLRAGDARRCRAGRRRAAGGDGGMSRSIEARKGTSTVSDFPFLLLMIAVPAVGAAVVAALPRAATCWPSRSRLGVSLVVLRARRPGHGGLRRRRRALPADHRHRLDPRLRRAVRARRRRHRAGDAAAHRRARAGGHRRLVARRARPAGGR